METIFDFNPTTEELKELFSYDKEVDTLVYGFSVIPVAKDQYKDVISNDGRIFDIALLLEHRNDDRAKEYWARIPDVERQYRCGFDDVQIPV